LAGGVNLFLYANGNPLKFIDPYGLITCGSGWNEPIVPDNPFGFSFSNCCEEHDRCYETCGQIKKNCDNNFENCMLNSCDSMGLGRPLRRSMCRNWANRYAWFVKTFGESSFRNAQKI
jgi:hypothetical protein